MSNLLISIVSPDNYEIVLVEDNSPDKSWAAITHAASRNFKGKDLKLSRSFGQHAAIMARLSHTRGDWIIVMDCDLQDAPEEMRQWSLNDHRYETR